MATKMSNKINGKAKPMKFESHFIIEGKKKRAIYKLPKSLGYYSYHFRDPINKDGVISELEYIELNDRGIVNPDDWHTDTSMDIRERRARVKMYIEQFLIMKRKQEIDKGAKK